MDHLDSQVQQAIAEKEDSPVKEDLLVNQVLLVLVENQELKEETVQRFVL